MESLGLDESGLECGAWINRSDYKKKCSLLFQKKVWPFYPCNVSIQEHVIHHPGKGVCYSDKNDYFQS